MLQQPIADLMAEAVVDQFEAVEVEEHQRQRAAGALRARHRPAQAIAKQGAVGQSGQAVEVGEALQALLRVGAFGRVAQVNDDQRPRRTVDLRDANPQRLACRLRAAHGDVAIAQRERGSGVELRQAVGDVAADDGVDIEFEQGRGQGVAREHGAIGAADQQAVARTLEQGLEQGILAQGERVGRVIGAIAQPTLKGRPGAARAHGGGCRWSAVVQAGSRGEADASRSSIIESQSAHGAQHAGANAHCATLCHVLSA